VRGVLLGKAVLLYRAGNKYQDAVKKDADARIAEAKQGASEADAKAAEANLGAAKANEGLAKSNEEIARLIAEGEAAKTERVEADKQIAIAKVNAARADEGAAKAAAEVARLQIVVANAETKRAEAERALLELQERVNPRHLTSEQVVALINFLKERPKGYVKLVCLEGSAEPCAFAIELSKVLNLAGWDVKVTSSASWGVKVGLILHTIADVAPERAVVLRDALNSIGFPTELQVAAGGASDEDVALIVGHKF
jgi:hypothetical protein